ncbi:S8 family peptidase [Burkholderia pseudomultivorans]|uniref:Extracellular basic protease n=1 Tax=Burkholderia pseudomultivorans TaxID=1207504 RepID=A0ABU2DX20_9BURK|nr:S8 family peptidase [Burkholderia pseudomultivorans]MDR8726440.1 Extracellular basic protease [Burkholderia pseudomultivorans]MDR8733664.1 Extracellular basic protease [Burkholderia pseudomultivorans]MDR8740190.1 Extracellular basic protease [Burkholderia pseudomultivorans]MDR8752141.1 Extracellular basic protease [Burkholderia pseudomultivorans]MDR8776536.1 Extracellular basic protease [Burkholderia pseudomultivorans]
MSAKRFNFASARARHAHMLAGVLSAAVLLPLAGCGGGGGDGSSPSSSNASPAPTPAPTTPTTPPASSSSNACATQQAAVQMAAQTVAPTEPPIDHLIVRLKTSTATHAMAAVDTASRFDAVIQRSMTRWSAPTATARAYASGVAPAALNVQVERTVSNGAAVLSLGQRIAATDATALAQAFAADADVDYAEPDHPMKVRDTPSDPDYSQQWYLSDPTAGIDMPPAWNVTKGSPAVVTAVLDTGYRPHADLKDNLLPGYSFISSASTSNNGLTRGPDASDPGDWVTQQEIDNASGPFYHCAAEPNASTWHGTRVMGVVGANANNGIGIAGVSWLGRILPVRVLGKCGGTTSDIADAMRWAAGIPVNGVPNNPTPAKVINLSLGGVGACSTTFQQAIDDVTAKGVTVVVAAGNDGLSTGQDQPANCRGVISVGATDATGRRASFSNFGTDVSLSAPGVNILSTSNAGTTTPGADTYDTDNGTSFATPQVAGVAALMLTVNGNLTPAQIQQKLQGGTRAAKLAAGTACTALPAGSGILDAGSAVASASQ